MGVAASWVGCVLAVAAAGCGDERAADPSRTKAQVAEVERQQGEVDRLTVKLDFIFEEVARVERQLIDATDDAARAAALEKLQFLGTELARVKRELEAVRRDGQRSKTPAASGW